MDQGIANYVKNAFAQGKTNNEIKEVLLKGKHTLGEVEAVIAYVIEHPDGQLPESQKMEPKRMTYIPEAHSELTPAPTSVDRAAPDTVYTGIFSGRIGRVAYLFGSILLSFIYVGIVGLFTLSQANLLSIPISPIIVATIYGIIGIAIFIFSLALTIRRFHDANHAGTLAILLFIPIVNFFTGLYLLFAPGNELRNEHGQPKNTEHETLIGTIVNKNVSKLISYMIYILVLVGIYFFATEMMNTVSELTETDFMEQIEALKNIQSSL